MGGANGPGRVTARGARTSTRPFRSRTVVEGSRGTTCRVGDSVPTRTCTFTEGEAGEAGEAWGVHTGPEQRMGIDTVFAGTGTSLKGQLWGEELGGNGLATIFVGVLETEITAACAI